VNTARKLEKELAIQAGFITTVMAEPYTSADFEARIIGERYMFCFCKGI
jgi:hypothetical protein